MPASTKLGIRAYLLIALSFVIGVLAADLSSKIGAADDHVEFVAIVAEALAQSE